MKKLVKNNNNNKKLITLFIVVSIVCGFQARSEPTVKNSKEFINKLEVNVPKIMDEYFVPGVAVAVIQNGEIVHKRGYGYSDLSKNKRVTTSTGFNIGSISKTVAAWGVMRLVEEGKLSLDAPVEKYLKRWHLPSTKFDAKGVTIRRLLSHTAGLPSRYYPGWGPDDELPSLEESLSGTKVRSGAVRLVMEPGKHYQYSGGGYTLLQLLIEEVTGQRFEDYMRDQILTPLGMLKSSFTLSPEIVSASSVGYDRWGQPTPILRFTAMAAAGLHTTIEDLGKFAIATMKGPNSEIAGRGLLTPDTIIEMLTPAAATESSFGLGYTVDRLPNGMVTNGHRGANKGWHAYLNFVPETGDGIIVTSNGTNGSYVDSQIVCMWTQWVSGSESDPGCKKAKPVAVEMYSTIKEKGVGAAIKQYHQLKKMSPMDYEFDEGQLNTLGYGLLGQNENEGAIEILQLNTTLFPASENAFDSLAEVYMYSGRNPLAIQNYNNVLGLNPKNRHAQNMLKKLTKGN